MYAIIIGVFFFFQLSFLMYTSYFVLFGHFFYHAYLAGDGEQGIKEKVLQDGVTIISAATDSTITKLSNENDTERNFNKNTNDPSSGRLEMFSIIK